MEPIGYIRHSLALQQQDGVGTSLSVQTSSSRDFELMTPCFHAECYIHSATGPSHTSTVSLEGTWFLLPNLMEILCWISCLIRLSIEGTPKIYKQIAWVTWEWSNRVDCMACAKFFHSSTFWMFFFHLAWHSGLQMANKRVANLIRE